MSNLIKLLSDKVANQIAAGEVIQRPASVLKELMENAIDAGADKIDVFVKDAGRAMIMVQDNGCGMAEMDARMCFERHATSKISEHDDLYNIRSFGFRGEALASIAAVAQVELKTKRTEDELGVKINIEGSKFIDQQPVSCKSGTSFTVRNLFFNVPARRSFLKSNNVELRHLIEEFTRIALSYPDKSFSLQNDEREVHKLKSSNLSQRIVQLMGNSSKEQLVPVKENTTIINFNGFIGKPQFAKRSRGDQYFFVNNRFIKSSYLHHAVMKAFEGILPEGQYPLYVIFIDVDPANIDVNVHPTKTEIKFSDEKSVYAILLSGIRRSLAQYSVAPTIDFEVERNFTNWTQNSSNKVLQNSASPFAGSSSSLAGIVDSNAVVEKLEEGNYQMQTLIQEEPKQSSFANNQASSNQDKPVFQLHNTFIMAQIKSGMLVINQARAHERILYEQFLKQITSSEPSSQRILFQEQLELSAMDALILHDIMSEVNNIGFELEAVKPDEFVIKGIPANMELGMTKQIIHDLIEQYKSNKNEFKLNANETLAKSLAKSCAVRSGRALTAPEMNSIINDLFACTDPMHSTDGLPTITKINLHQIEDFFKERK